VCDLLAEGQIVGGSPIHQPGQLWRRQADLHAGLHLPTQQGEKARLRGERRPHGF